MSDTPKIETAQERVERELVENARRQGRPVRYDPTGTPHVGARADEK